MSNSKRQRLQESLLASSESLEDSQSYDGVYLGYTWGHRCQWCSTLLPDWWMGEKTCIDCKIEGPTIFNRNTRGLYRNISVNTGLPIYSRFFECGGLGCNMSLLPYNSRWKSAPELCLQCHHNLMRPIVENGEIILTHDGPYDELKN